jgi:2-phospho-L-lactate transferase CofD
VETMYVVGFGGGTGLGVAGASLVWPRDPRIHGHLITAASDDHPKSSTAALGKGFAHAGDLGRVLDALHEAHFDRRWLLKQSAIRYRSGIPAGKTFGEMYAEAFSPASRPAAYLDPEKMLRSILKLLHVGEPDKKVLELILEAFRYVFEESDFKKHSFRNMRLYVLEKVAARHNIDPEIALRAAHTLHGIPPEFFVEPVTRQSGTLIGERAFGEPIIGQGRIDFLHRDPTFDFLNPIVRYRMEPRTFPSRSVLQAMLKANAFLFAPGSPGGNLWSLFSMERMKEVFAQATHPSRHTPIILVTNLLTEFGSTRFQKPWSAVDLFMMVHAATGQWPTHVIHDTTPYAAADLAAYLPEVKIQLGDWSKLPSRAPMPLIIEGRFSKQVPDDDFGSVEDDFATKQKLIHDYKKLGPVFIDLLCPVSPAAARALA